MFLFLRVNRIPQTFSNDYDNPIRLDDRKSESLQCLLGSYVLGNYMYYHV